MIAISLQSALRFCLVALALFGPLLHVHRAAGQDGAASQGNNELAEGRAVSGLQLIGDSQQLYLVLINSIPDASNPRQPLVGSSVFRRTTGETKWQFVGNVVGLTADLAIWRNQLVLLQPDGHWRTVDSGTSAAGINPKDGLLIRLASDGTSLYALRALGAELRLLRLQAGSWADLGPVPLPAELSEPETQTTELAIHGNAAHVAFLTGKGRISVIRSGELPLAETTRPATTRSAVQADAPAELVWTPVADFAPVQPALTLRLFDLGDRLGLWADPGTTTGGDLYFLPEASAAAPGAGSPDARPASIGLGANNGEAAVSGNRVRFFYDPADDTEPTDAPNAPVPEVLERVFDFSGNALGEPTPLDLPLGIGTEDKLSVLAAAVVFGGLFVAILLSWRRRAETPIAVLEAAFTLPLASRTKRLLAGLIDASPFVLATAYLMATHPETNALTMTPRYLFIELVAAAAVITHTMICEVISGRTLGKMIMGLRVVDLSGLPAAPSRIVMRNLFKAIDLILLLPLVSILISPLRQSIGDSASGTLVLESAPLPPSDTPE